MARAIRRCGESLRTIKPAKGGTGTLGGTPPQGSRSQAAIKPAQGGDRRSKGGHAPVDSRTSAATAAGLSRDQKRDALRVARAERRTGELIKEHDMRRRNPGPGRREKVSTASETFSLKALKITPDQSSDWQKRGGDRKASSARSENDRPSLKTLGLTENQSSDWQTLAASLEAAVGAALGVAEIGRPEKGSTQGTFSKADRFRFRLMVTSTVR